jgi:hypothetical protein
MRARAQSIAAALAGVLVLTLAAPAAAAVRAASPPPQGCTPVALAAAATSTGTVCVHGVVVTQTSASQEQNRTAFTVTDHTSTLGASVPNWWPSGGPVAGMVITMWGHMSGGAFLVDRWLDLTHGTGPAPDGPYPEVSALAVSSGQIPEHRMVWIPTFAFLLDPQNTGDGDIHVQTANGCPGAGVTTETTPPLRGYVDHPALPGLVSSSDTSDVPSNHVADAPPVGVPVMILGATRYDYGFGWWELHPIRAWRFLTSAETSQLIAQCGAHPVPELDKSGPVPAPYGFPPCTDGSEFGGPPGFGPCGPRCYVAHTAIGQPEQLVGPCTGIAPVVTASQEGQPPAGTSSTPSSPPAPAPAPGPGGGNQNGRAPGSTAPASGSGTTGVASNADAFQSPQMLAVLARSYGPLCARLRAQGHAGRAYDRCLAAMARLAGGETHSPRFACQGEPRRPLPRGRRRSDSYYRRCVAAGARLLAVLRGARIAEN